MTDKQLNALLDYIDAKILRSGEDQARLNLIESFGFKVNNAGRPVVSTTNDDNIFGSFFG